MPRVSSFLNSILMKAWFNRYRWIFFQQAKKWILHIWNTSHRASTTHSLSEGGGVAYLNLWSMHTGCWSYVADSQKNKRVILDKVHMVEVFLLPPLLWSWGFDCSCVLVHFKSLCMLFHNKKLTGFFFFFLASSKRSGNLQCYKNRCSFSSVVWNTKCVKGWNLKRTLF